MPAPFDSFIPCQIVTLKKARFSYQKYADELGLKTKSTAQSVLRRYNKNKRFLPKKGTGRLPKLLEKTQRKLVKDVLEDPKTTLERIRVKYNSFSTNQSISRTTVRRILRKHGVFSRVAAKKNSIKKMSASIIKNFFRENEREVLDWPPYNPDLNIIENLWAIVKKRLAKQSVSWENLEDKVQEIWNSIELETVQKPYDSISERLEAVASCNGFISRF